MVHENQGGNSDKISMSTHQIPDQINTHQHSSNTDQILIKHAQNTDQIFIKYYSKNDQIR